MLFVHGTTAARAASIQRDGALVSQLTDIYAVPATYIGVQMAAAFARQKEEIDGLDEGGPALVFFETDETPTVSEDTGVGVEVCCWWTDHLPIRNVSVVKVSPDLDAEPDFLPLQWCYAASPAESETIRRRGAICLAEGVPAYPATAEGKKRALAMARVSGKRGGLVLVTFRARRAPDDIVLDAGLFLTSYLPVQVVSLEPASEAA